jgi:glyoxylase I family protein
MDFIPHHVAVTVKDLDSAFSFYKHFGFKVVNHWTAEDGSCDIVHMQLGEYLMELFRYSDWKPAPDAMSSLATDLPTIGTKHHGVRVANVDDAHAWVKAQGLIPESDVREGKTGVRYFFVKDPSGNFFEIAEDKRPFLRQI